MDFSNFWWQAAEAPPGPGPSIGNSLRFRGQNVGSDQEYCLRRSNGTNCQSVRTMSVWIKTVAKQPKPSAILSLGPSFSAAYDAWSLTLNDETNSNSFAFGSNQLGIYFGGASYLGLPPKYRDPSAWYHIVVQTDGADNILFVNGENIGTLSSSEKLSGDITIGQLPAAWGLPRTFNGYMAHFYFIDGQALEPTAFGQYDANMVWTPKEYEGDFGANGFFLDFSDPADIGADRSGNGNHFTPTGFELANQLSSNWDHMPDSPTQNHSTLNPLHDNDELVFFKANLDVDAINTSHGSTAGTTMPVSSGKWYAEVKRTGGSAVNAMIGICSADGFDANRQPNESYLGGVGTIYLQNGWAAQSAGTFDYGDPYGNDEDIGIVLDLDSSPKTVSFINKGVNQGALTIPDREYVIACGNGQGSSNIRYVLNYGQRPFTYTPPAGFEPLQTQELPDAPIPNGRDHFQAITDTGANILTAAQTAFPDGLWWIKDRVNSNQHQFVDSVRGGNLALQTPALGVETAYVAPAGSSVAWCWNAGGAAVANGDGSIPSQVAANTDAGFSIVTYSGTGAAGATVGHGLSKAPDMYVVKRRDGGAGNTNWFVYHSGLDNPGSQFVMLNQNSAVQTNSSFWNDTQPTADVFSLGTNVEVNGGNLVAYCWHSVPGYSAFGSYAGNGSNDGPFIALSFRPAFFLHKRIDAGDSNQNWRLWDSTRGTVNPVDIWLQPNTAGQENSADAGAMDFLSNGVKVRATDTTNNNANGGIYIYAAFAENPFGGDNIAPATAR